MASVNACPSLANRSKMTVSAPLQYSLILPSGVRTTADMRFRVELNSRMFRIWYSRCSPSMVTKTDCGLRVCNAIPVSASALGAEVTTPKDKTNRKGVPEDVGALHESRLVRTARLVHDLLVLELRNDRMARCEEGQELLNDARRLVPGTGILLQVAEREHLALLRLLDDVGVGNAADGALAELHLVACQGARLVAEDVFDLTELLDEGGGPAQRGSIGRSVVHVCAHRVT